MSNTPDLPPPVPPTVIPPVVATLDPDLANAYLAGVPGVVQAVANGMTTNAMIVNDLIRTGASMAGMPSAIVQMVSDRQKEIDAQREAENERVRKLAASAVGLGMMAASIPAEAGMYYGGEGKPSSPASSQGQYGEFSSWAEWSKAVAQEMEEVSQRSADRAAISESTWRNEMTHDQRVASAGESVIDSKQVLKRLVEERKQLDTELASDKYSTEDRQMIEKMLATGSAQGGLRTEAGRADARRQIDEMPAHLQDIATRVYTNATSGLDQMRSLSKAVNGRDVTVTGSPDGKPDLTEADKETQRQADKLRQRIQSSPEFANDKDFAADVSRKADTAMQQGAGSTSTTTLQVNADNLAAGATVDTQVAKVSAPIQF